MAVKLKVWGLIVGLVVLGGMGFTAGTERPTPAHPGITNNALLVAVTPEGRASLTQIDGSTVNAVIPATLRTDLPVELCFNVTVQSPDLEYMDRFTVDLPDTWTVNAVRHGPPGGGRSEEGVEPGNGLYWQTVGYPSSWGAWGNGTYNFCASVTVPDCSGSPWNLPWTIIGDQFGAPPHTISGTMATRCLAPGLYLTPASSAVVGCAALTETHSLNLLNYTGADGVFSFSYAAISSETEGNVVIGGPISHTLPAGADVDLPVTLLPDACIPAGVDVVALTTASGNGYTATATLTTTIGGDSVWADVATGNEPSLYWGHSYYHGGKICFVGGLTGTASPVPTTAHRCYDIHTRTWSSRAPMPAARFGGAYGLIGDRFYVAGGFDADFIGYRTLYIYTINTNTWSIGANLPTARGGQASGVVRGQLYSAGGSSKSSYPADCPTYVYNPATNTWTTRASCPLQGGYGFLLGGSMGSDYHGRFFAGGHYDAYYGWYAYNPATNAWETLANLPYHRTPLIVEDPRNGRIYALGGLVGWTPQRGGWAYDYATDTWDASPPDLQTAQGGSLGPRHGSFGDPHIETFWTLGGTRGQGALEPAPFERWQDCPFCAQRGWLQGRVFDAETAGRPPVTPAFVFLEPGKVTLPVETTTGQFGPTELIAWAYTATAYAPGYALGGSDTVTITTGVTHTQEYALFRPSVVLTPTALAPLTAYVGRTTPVTLTLVNVGHAPLVFRVAESGLPTQGRAQSGTGLSAPQSLSSPGVTVEPQLAAALADDETLGYLIRFRERPDLTAAYTMDWETRGEFVMQALQTTAERAQAQVRAYLDARSVPYQAFWVDNVIAVERSNRQIFEGLLRYTEIGSLHTRRTLGLIEFTTGAPSSGNATGPNLTHIRTDAVWDMGITGAGIVVANIDTGVRYTHRALVAHYRGTLENGIFVHAANWLDASTGKAVPSDDHGHGSHTMGIMIGDDDVENHIGMAPGAQWIACDACNADSGCPDAALLTCAEWVLAPYPVDNPYRRDPDKRPHIVNNSWGDCGRAYDGWFQNVVDAWHAAGIYPVFSNGNASNCHYAYPPGLNTVGNPARYGNVTGVGSTGQSDGLYAVHSNWGPTDNPDTLNPRGYANLKPQVVAPGVNIRSSLNGSDTAYASWSGTSMSAPHVAGLIALMWEAGPCLIGDYAATETLIEQTATPIPYATRNGDEGPDNVPNHATGWGEIDALAAVQAAAAACDLPWLTVHLLSGTVAGPGTVEVNMALDCPAPGRYTAALKVFHNDPSTRTLSVPVQVACYRCTPLTTVDFTWAPLYPETGQDVVFTAVPPTFTAFLPITYTWYLGDGGTAPGNPVTHTYAQSGVYPVRLTATNGCSTVEMTHSISVTGAPVMPTYGVALRPSVAEARGEPRATVVYTLTVHNTGSVADTFDLSIGGAQWPTMLSTTQVNLSAGTMTQMYVNVNIPTDLSMPTDVATITARSQGNATVSAASRLRTTTIKPRVYLPLIIRGA